MAQPVIPSFVQPVIQFRDKDVGAVITTTITVTGIDPTGATFKLEVDNGFGERTMSVDPNTGITQIATTPLVQFTVVATYIVQAGEFVQGKFNAQVKLVKGSITVYTNEIFVINVLKATN